MRKRMLSAVLVLCMVLTLFPGVAWAAEEVDLYDMLQSSGAVGYRDLPALFSVPFNQLEKHLPIKNGSVSDYGDYYYEHQQTGTYNGQDYTINVRTCDYDYIRENPGISGNPVIATAPAESTEILDVDIRCSGKGSLEETGYYGPVGFRDINFGDRFATAISKLGLNADVLKSSKGLEIDIPSSGPAFGMVYKDGEQGWISGSDPGSPVIDVTFYSSTEMKDGKHIQLIFGDNERLNYVRYHNYDLLAELIESSEPGPTPPDPSDPQIVSVFPAHGSTNVGYDASDPPVFRITFDRDIASGEREDLANVDLDSPGAFKIYRASDDKLIYPDDENYQSYSKYDFQTVYNQKNTLSITPINRHVLLKPGTEYYITMGEGFVKLVDGTTNPKIGKGEWSFNTKIFEKEGTFTFPGSNGKNIEYNYSYSDKFFYDTGNKYNHALANMSLNLAVSAFNSREASTSNYNELVAAKNVRKLLSDINFKDIETDVDDGNNSYNGMPYTNSIAAAYAKKNIATGYGDFTLIAVAIRGGGYEAEWGGNFTVGQKGDHTGFQLASDKVLAGLKKYINSKGISGDIKIWITGYSRAAATANLTAAAIDDGKLFTGTNAVNNLVVHLSTADVYAYTFETPMGTTNNASSFLYNNIFNIVNPIDLVPKVAPDAWGFGRYGITYYMPSGNTNAVGYSDVIMQVTKEYSKIINGTDNGPLLAIKQLTNQDAILDRFLDILSTRMPRTTYSPKYEHLLVPIVSEVMGADGNQYGENIFWAIEEFCLRYPDDAADLISSLKQALGNKVFWYVLGEQGAEQIIKHTGILDWLNPDGSTAIDTMLMVGDIIFQSHYPEVTMAWMRTINGADGYGSGKYRKLYVNCPVDVSVYDSDNRLVAQIINDDPQIIEESLIGFYIDGDGQKIVILPTDMEYHVVVDATDDGTMTYTVEEYDIDTDSTTRLVGYQNINIEKGGSFNGLIENLDNVPSASYPLYMNGSTEALTPSINQTGEVVQNYTVTVSSSGNGTVTGGGYYRNGEFAKVTATADHGETFLGWYVGNEQISSDVEYRFLVNSNVDIIAKFTTNTNYDNPNPPDRPTNPSDSSTSDSDSSPSHSITIPSRVTGGTVKVIPTSASERQRVTITVKANYGYKLDKLTVTDSKGNKLELTDKGDGKYTFIMPDSKVSVDAVFAKIEETPTQSAMNFTDVPANAYYVDAVAWAVEKGITAGTSANAFSPDAPCTRAQIVTFLWRAAGSPMTSGNNPFTDVDSNSYYYNAVQWAVAQGITAGTSADTFSPNAPCTRGQAVTFLYRNEKSPAVSGSNPFTDVASDSYCTNAVQWAVTKGITAGIGANTFGQNNECTRSQIVSFMYRNRGN